MRLQGKVALVSGSTRGIGRSIAQMFAAEGARVAVTGRTKERGQKVVNLIRDAGGEAQFFELDVRSEDSVREVSAAVVDRFGTLTTLVNNAAPTVEVGTSIKRLTDVSTEEWNYVITAGLTGPVFWACKYGIPYLARRRGRGHREHQLRPVGHRPARVQCLLGDQGGDEQPDPLDCGRGG